MSTRAPIRLAALVPVACAAALLAACGSSAGGNTASAGGTTAAGGSSPAAGGGSPATSSPAPATSSPTPVSDSGASGSKCTDLTTAAASAAVGKPTTVTLDTSGTPLPGLTICNLTVADEVYPIQLAVDDNANEAEFSEDEQAFTGVDVSGIGDKAFTSAVGVEVLSGSVDIKVMGPAGPVLSGNYTVPTAIAKAMVSALQ